MTGQRLLLVDDDPDTLRLGKLCLESMGAFDVDTCTSGEEALLKARETKPAAVLLDVVMPGMDGPTTLAHLRADPETQKIPVILITARTAPDDLQRYRALGARGVIGKPFRPTFMVSQVKRLLHL